MRFIWDDKYSVGIEIFDEQHKHFFELTNAIYDLLEKQNLDRVKLEAAVNDMANYALYHLSSEEEAFKNYPYPDKDKHLQAHEDYRVKIRGLFNKSRIADSQQIMPLTKNVVDFASDWLMSHILLIDKGYSNYLAVNLK
jgi:hemerythrin